MKEQDFITVAGIQWATENLKLKGEKLFNFDAAQAAAEEIGLRVPTKQEWGKLNEIPHTFNKTHLEFIADNKEDILRLPCDTYNLYYEKDDGSCGYYWSACDIEGSYGYYFEFNSERSSSEVFRHKTHPLSVRCVK